MGGNCSFYEESAWRERLEASADQWSMHAFLRFNDEIGGRAEALNRLSGVLDVSPERLRWRPAMAVLAEHDQVDLGFTREDVLETWRANNGIPETCPREAIEDGLCLFHLPPHRKDDAEVRDRLVEAVRSGERADRQLDGARFGDLDLSGLDLGADRVSPIDLRFAQIEGELNLGKTVIPWGIFSMRFAQVEGPAKCRSAQFGSTATFYHVTFAESVSFYRARFESKARFCGVSVGGYANFGKATFEQTANFRYAKFAGDANFREATFRGPAEFWETAFEGTVGFQDVTFDGPAQFVEVSASDTIDLDGASLAEGRVQRGDTPVPFDLTGATVGDVAFECDAGDELAGVRFRETAFDGFDFPEHRRGLATYEWQIHSYEPSSEGIVTSLGRRLGLWGPAVVGPQAAPTEAESTYLKAKNGANEMGDTVAASEFFRREMAYRRVGHGRRIRTGGRLRTRTWSAWRWAANLGLGMTAGYGERPSRVVLSALAIIAMFAIVYRLVVAAAVPGAPGWQAYLLFSFQSFITFILGPPPSPPSFGLRLASAVLGFIGAFFVALFVFTLTRSIDR